MAIRRHWRRHRLQSKVVAEVAGVVPDWTLTPLDRRLDIDGGAPKHFADFLDLVANTTVASFQSLPKVEAAPTMCLLAARRLKDERLTNIK